MGVTIGVTGAVVLTAFSIGIAIKCYILKRKARKFLQKHSLHSLPFEMYSITHTGYPCLLPSDCKPTCTSESQLKLQNKVNQYLINTLTEIL